MVGLVAGVVVDCDADESIAVGVVDNTN